ncbi:hypothetical protein ACSQ67_003940 [Phaseolus vulgaris]
MVTIFLDHLGSIHWSIPRPFPPSRSLFRPLGFIVKGWNETSLQCLEEAVKPCITSTSTPNQLKEGQSWHQRMLSSLSVSAFLSHHFSEVTDYSFTADMETELDNVSAGLTEWKGLLRDYWTRFKSYCERTSNVHIHQVEKMLEKNLAIFYLLLFQIRVGYIAKTLYGTEEEEDASQPSTRVEEPKLLGVTSASNEKVLLKTGPYGFYVQLGEDRKGYIPKRASVSHVKDVGSITLEDALELLQYPLTLGNHPKDGQPVIIKLARVGFSVRHRRTIASVPKNIKPTDVTLEKALEFLSGKDVRRSGRPKGKSKAQEVEVIEAF